MARFEKVEENKVKIFFEVGSERFEEGLVYSYNKSKGELFVPGFRKGRVPRKVIEMNFGKEIFYDEALQFVLPDAYENAVKELELDTVSKPEVDVDEISTESGVQFTAEVYIKPQVDIADYRGLSYKPYPLEVTEEEINASINQTREQNSRIITVTDRPIEEGDIAVIDFEGFMDGEAFEGGKGENYELTIGSHMFIDTFEEQLIGRTAGDELEVNVTFPEGYTQKELAGKPATFKVTVHEIKVKELPEADDEFAQDISEFDTLEAYKQDIVEKMRKAKEGDADADKERQLMEQIIEKAVMDVPEIMFENEIDRMVSEFSQRLRYQGMSMEMFLNYAGQTQEDLRKMYRENAERLVKGRLALEAVADREGIEISREAQEEEVRAMAGQAKMDFDVLMESLHEEELKDLTETLKVREALKVVMDSAVESE